MFGLVEWSNHIVSERAGGTDHVHSQFFVLELSSHSGHSLDKQFYRDNVRLSALSEAWLLREHDADEFERRWPLLSEERYVVQVETIQSSSKTETNTLWLM